MTEHAIIVGAMKAGTTELFDALSEHPSICPSRNKETNFFCETDETKLAYAVYRKEWPRTNAKVLLEASPNYTSTRALRHVPERIRGVLGDEAKLIYIVRNPLERAQSHVRHRAKRAGRDLDSDGSLRVAIAQSRYYQRIEAFRECFSRDRMFVVSLEEFRDDRAGTLARMCEFLGVDAGFEFPEPRDIANRGHKTTQLDLLLGRKRWLRRILRRVAPTRMRDRIRIWAERKLPARLRTEMTAGEWAHVAYELYDDTTRLAELEGIDYTPSLNAVLSQHEWIEQPSS